TTSVNSISSIDSNNKNSTKSSPRSSRANQRLSSQSFSQGNTKNLYTCNKIEEVNHSEPTLVIQQKLDLQSTKKNEASPLTSINYTTLGSNTSLQQKSIEEKRKQTLVNNDSEKKFKVSGSASVETSKLPKPTPNTLGDFSVLENNNKLNSIPYNESLKFVNSIPLNSALIGTSFTELSRIESGSVLVDNFFKDSEELISTGVNFNEKINSEVVEKFPNTKISNEKIAGVNTSINVADSSMMDSKSFLVDEKNNEKFFGQSLINGESLLNTNFFSVSSEESLKKNLNAASSIPNQLELGNKMKSSDIRSQSMQPTTAIKISLAAQIQSRSRAASAAAADRNQNRIRSMSNLSTSEHFSKSRGDVASQMGNSDSNNNLTGGGKLDNPDHLIEQLKLGLTKQQSQKNFIKQNSSSSVSNASNGKQHLMLKVSGIKPNSLTQLPHISTKSPHPPRSPFAPKVPSSSFIIDNSVLEHMEVTENSFHFETNSLENKDGGESFNFNANQKESSEKLDENFVEYLSKSSGGLFNMTSGWELQGMIGGTIGLAIIGAIIQFNCSSHRENVGHSKV
ncbi:hypothetical protein HK099_001549, partial [Clydaea vesicula]